MLRSGRREPASSPWSTCGAITRSMTGCGPTSGTGMCGINSAGRSGTTRTRRIVTSSSSTPMTHFSPGMAGDATGVERSGLRAWSAASASSAYHTERLPAHLHKHATSAIQLAGAIEEHVGQREAAARADQRRSCRTRISPSSRRSRRSRPKPTSCLSSSRDTRRRPISTCGPASGRPSRISARPPGVPGVSGAPVGESLTKVFQHKMMAAGGRRRHQRVHHGPARQVEPDRARGCSSPS